MAVEKLILRSILYGADKIPDSWFEKLPGGYYRDSQGRKRKIADKTPKNDDPKTTPRGRKAEPEDLYPEQEDQERGRDSRRDRYRGRSTSSYDGGADYDNDYYGYREGGGPTRSKSRRRRRSEDEDRHADHHARRSERHGDGRRSHRRHNDDRHRGALSPSRAPDYDRRRSTAYLDRPPNDAQARSFAVDPLARRAEIDAGRGSAGLQYPGRNYAAFIADELPPPPIARNGPISNGYVPYAHIYGTARQPAPQPEFSPDSFFNHSAMRSRGSPVAPHAQSHSQTPFYQQAPLAQERNASGFSQKGYEPHGDTRQSRNERRDDASHFKSVQYADPRSQPEPQKSKSTRRRPDRYCSDIDGSYGEAARRERRNEGYYSE